MKEKNLQFEYISLLLLHLFENNSIFLKLSIRIIEEFIITAWLTLLYIPLFEFTVFTVVLFEHVYVLHKTVTLFWQ
jgi:hypothetical protein